MKQYFSQRLPLTVLVLLFLSLPLFAQDVRVSITLRDASLKELFRAIEEQTSYSFSYRDSELEGKPAVNVEVRDMQLSRLLSSELSKAGLQYTLVEDKIVVTPASLSGDRTPVRLSGTVKDRAGQPVIGASAMIKGTMTGVVTDLDGRFSISVHKGDVLVFSSLGYVTEEYRVGSIANVDIVLDENHEMLEEAVAVGYGTTLRKNLTTSVATVKPDRISQAASSNVSQLLMRQAAGLRANISSTQPGGNVDISIRGGGTLSISWTA